MTGLPFFWGIHTARCDWCGAYPVAHWYLPLRAVPRQPRKACDDCARWGEWQTAKAEYHSVRQWVAAQRPITYADFLVLETALHRMCKAFMRWNCPPPGKGG